MSLFSKSTCAYCKQNQLQMQMVCLAKECPKDKRVFCAICFTNDDTCQQDHFELKKQKKQTFLLSKLNDEINLRKLKVEKKINQCKKVLEETNNLSKLNNNFI